MLVCLFFSNKSVSRRINLSLLELEEDGVRIALTIVDTPGFGDNIDNEFAYVRPILYVILRLSYDQVPGDCWVLGTPIR